MKRFKTFKYIALVVVAFLGNSCNSLLEEEPRVEIVPSFFNTPSGLLGGIAGVYNSIRGGYGTEGHNLQQMGGTDEHLRGGSAQAPQFFDYNGILPSNMNGGFAVYTSINTLNGILEIGPTTTIPEETKNQYLGQARFLRAFLYYDLVITFGDVPLHTTFITAPSQADSRSPILDVYSVIIDDLTVAADLLPNTVTAPFLGKAAAKGAALYLLGKAYLSRGWLTDNQADFTQAYTILSDLITNRATYGLDLWQNYADAFTVANDYGKENIFVSDHSNNATYGLYQQGASGGAAQNILPWLHRYNYPAVLGINSTVDASGKIANGNPQMLFRTVAYGRPYTRIRPNNPYVLGQAFADRLNDSRYQNTFQTVWISNMNAAGQAATSGPGVTGSRGTLTVGVDTAVWFSDFEVPGAPQAFGSRPFKGIIVTPNMQTNTVYPAVKKLDDPTRAAPNDPSTRPVVIYRFADAYLLAAEAAFKLGNLQNAADMLNVIRKRAAFRTSYPPGITQISAEAAMTITPAEVTLDFILDERTREFYGEGYRRNDLVRTKSLVRRVKDWNVEAAPNITENHVLRPIPQDQIDRVTTGDCIGNACWQNPGY